MKKFLSLYYKKGIKVSACPRFVSQYFKKEKQMEGSKSHCLYKRKKCLAKLMQTSSCEKVAKTYM